MSKITVNRKANGLTIAEIFSSNIYNIIRSCLGWWFLKLYQQIKNFWKIYNKVNSIASIDIILKSLLQYLDKILG